MGRPDRSSDTCALPVTLPMLLDEAGEQCKPKAIFISNPSNPAGHVQSRKSIQEVIQFAAAEGLLLLVDEVYQDYVIQDGVEFISYKKILFEMGPVYSDTVQLASFHSISSLGECGLRAGFMELVNIDPNVMHFVDTMLCTDISTSVMGQLALDLMVKPPKPGDSSYHTYTQERQVEAGTLYCDQLMLEQAVLIGSGSSHGPFAGKSHFRLCILVSSDVLEEALSRIQKFHQSLVSAI
ncbi:hypothetical protein WMY93_025435 [Mugilogobius chulae]|uniref:alanine transaminase n=1 Tax=Mugilogobius chulae TaxID=88201 RepID=A0AAW0N7F0_9GOBI